MSELTQTSPDPPGDLCGGTLAASIVFSACCCSPARWTARPSAATRPLRRASTASAASDGVNDPTADSFTAEATGDTAGTHRAGAQPRTDAGAHPGAGPRAHL